MRWAASARSRSSTSRRSSARPASDAGCSMRPPPMAARRAGTGSKLARRTCRAGAVPWTSTRPTASPRSGRASSRRFSGQNPYVEQLTGSIRGDCLDHVIVLNDCHLKRMLASYVRYDHSWRTHRSLEMDSEAAISSQSFLPRDDADARARVTTRSMMRSASPR